MNLHFKRICASKLFALELEIPIQEQKEVLKSRLSPSNVKGYTVLNKAFESVGILLSRHDQLDATFRLQLLDVVDRIRERVRFQILFEAAPNVHRD